MLLMVEKCISSKLCHAIYQYATSNSKYMKDYYKNKKSSYLNYWDVNNLCRCAMSQKSPLGGF